MSENEISLLIWLQSIDSQIDENRKRERILISHIEGVEQKLREIEEGIFTKKEELKQTKKERREKEVRIQEIDDLLQKHEEEKYKVKSRHEFEVLDREITTLENEKDREEDFLLELMEKEDELSNLLPTLEKESSVEKERLGEEKRKLNQEVVELKKKGENLVKEREKLTERISKIYYQQYEQLRKIKDGVAVVMVKDGVCGGCNVKVPPSLIGQMRHQQIVYCENCNRIIYLG